MAKNAYVGVDAVTRRIAQSYIGINNVARKVTKGYIGVDNVARQFLLGGTPLSKLTVGASVYMNVNGSPTEFYIMQQGRPYTENSLYDASCSGTWMIMKSLYNGGEKIQWDATNNDYAESDMHNFLNSTVLNQFDTNVRNIIKQVKIPYLSGTGNSGTVKSGADGLSTKIFLISGYEAGYTTSDNSYFPVDGAELRDTPSWGSTSMWLRSAYTANATHVWNITSTSRYTTSCTSSLAIRPVLILPSETLVDTNFNVIT